MTSCDHSDSIFQMVSSDQSSQADYRQRRRVYKRQWRIGIFGVGLVALCLVAAQANVSNNNSRITNAKRSRRSTDNSGNGTESTGTIPGKSNILPLA